jgi:antitoxin component of RelBE/YafQ-DinJ toxin-antitoxin module
MTTIIIKPSSVEEAKLLTTLLNKMNVEAEVYDDVKPNDETIKAMEDVENKKGKRVKNSEELFNDLGI